MAIQKAFVVTIDLSYKLLFKVLHHITCVTGLCYCRGTSNQCSSSYSSCDKPWSYLWQWQESELILADRTQYNRWWSAIGMLLSSVRLSICDAKHCG